MKTGFLRLAIIFILFFTSLSIIQFSTSDLPDNDGFYHIKMAWLMRTESLKPDFPWLPLTILNSREFFDHHFLFHAAMIPFTYGDLVVGAKWAAVLFGSLAFLSVYYLFEKQKIPFAWLWSLCILGVSEGFLYRMSIPRAQSLSLGILVLGIAWMLEGKYHRLAVLSFLYVWMYDAYPLILMLAILYTGAIALTEQKLDFRPIIYTTAGLMLGSLINPYFPSNLIFGYRHLLPKLLDATSLNVGNEWYPYTTLQLLKVSLPAFILAAAGLLGISLNNQKMNTRTMFSLLLVMFFGLMLIFSRRFIEYFPAFVLIFTCFCLAPYFAKKEASFFDEGIEEIKYNRADFWNGIFRQPVNRIPAQGEKFQARFLFVMLLVFCITSSIYSMMLTRNDMQGSYSSQTYAGSADWLVRHTPAGSLVFQSDWDDFPRLFFFDTHNTYLAGLDPGYFQISNPDLYALWVKITNGDVKNLSVIIPQKFGARFIHTDLRHTDFISAVQQDPNIQEVYRDKDSIIFEIFK